MEALKKQKDQEKEVWPDASDAFKNRFERIANNSLTRFSLGEPYILAAIDALGLFAALVLAKIFLWVFSPVLNSQSFSLQFSSVWVLQSALYFGLMGVVLVWFWSNGHYSKHRPFWDELRETVKILLVVGALNAALVFLAKWSVSRLWLGMTWSFAILLVPVFRVLGKKVLLRMGGWRRPTVIVGIGPNAQRAAEALCSERLMGYDIIAFIAGPTHTASQSATIKISDKQIPVLYYTQNLWGLVNDLNSPHLVVALEPGEENVQHSIMYGIGIDYRNIHIAPPVTGLPLYGTEVDRFFRHEVLLLNIRNNLVRTWAKAAKRAFDIAAAILSLILLAPMLVIIAFRIKLEDRGPVFYSQERAGKGGKAFRVHKFRSMVVNAHDVLLKWLEENPEIKREYKQNNHKLRNDPRVTKFGSWLRMYSLDELPQLWNVIKGEMSLVGPRPLLEREIAEYGKAIVLYEQTKPGITGIWQISGRSKTKFSDRANLDAWYIRNWSLWYDLYILLKTVVVVVKKDGAY